MSNIEKLNDSIGKVGFFFNNVYEKTLIIGRLVFATHDGKCEDEDGNYYDNFAAMTRSKLLEVIDTEFFF